MMNFEEGFRRIGIGILWVAALNGIIAAIFTGSLGVGVLVTAANMVVFYALLYIGVYVAKGFMKQSDKEKDKD